MSKIVNTNMKSWMNQFCKDFFGHMCHVICHWEAGELYLKDLKEGLHPYRDCALKLENLHSFIFPLYFSVVDLINNSQSNYPAECT